MNERSLSDDLAKKTVLVISQVYVPDPASVGQHMHDAAAELAARRHRVIVYTSSRGYDDPSNRYTKREIRNGVEIRRLPWSSFGKSSIVLRLLAQCIFLIQVCARAVFISELALILVSTSPPFAGISAVVIKFIRRVPVVFWTMDLNPDQMIALGIISEQSLLARMFDAINRLVLRKSDSVIALDRFMADRINSKYDVSDRIVVLPPWPHQELNEIIHHEDNPFRAMHGLNGKFVVMYSGNHGISNPIQTILHAAERLKYRDDIVFVFIGGGTQKQEVEAAIEVGNSNIKSLPYQPLEQLRYSLSAADVHVVTVGNNVVGICHPCKVYGAMSVGRPILLVGPDPNHISELIDGYDIGWQIEHRNIDKAVELIEMMATMSKLELRRMGRRAQKVIAGNLSKNTLCATLTDVIERCML